MEKIFFIHCAGNQGPHEGSENLVAYLKDALKNRYCVLAPQMPDPENPRYEPWKKKIDEELHDIENEIILIGHSLGGSVLLKYLSEENYKNDIRGLLLISSPFWGLKDWEIDEFILSKNFQSKISQISNLYFYHSLNDVWVPFKHLKAYAEKLPNAKIRVIEGSEHEFFYGLPELVMDLKNFEIW